MGPAARHWRNAQRLADHPDRRTDLYVLDRLLYKNAAQHRTQRHFSLLRRAARAASRLQAHTLPDHPSAAAARGYLALHRAWAAALLPAAAELLRLLGTGRFLPFATVALAALAALRASFANVLDTLRAWLAENHHDRERDLGVPLTPHAAAALAHRGRRPPPPIPTSSAAAAAPWNAQPVDHPHPKPRPAADIDSIFAALG